MGYTLALWEWALLVASLAAVVVFVACWGRFYVSIKLRRQRMANPPWLRMEDCTSKSSPDRAAC